MFNAIIIAIDIIADADADGMEDCVLWFIIRDFISLLTERSGGFFINKSGRIV